MQDIVELERRITAALDRIGVGLDRWGASSGDAARADEIARLTEALDEERMANAQLSERVRVLHERTALQGAGQEAGQDGAGHADAAPLETLQGQLAAQTDEIATLRRVLAEAGKEIASLRAARAAEAAELAEVVAALDPLVTDAETTGARDA